MPFFLLVPIWFVAVVVGLILLFIPRARFLSSYIVLGATGGLFVSFFLSTVVLVIVPRLFVALGITNAGGIGAISVIGGYLGGIGLGGLLGILIGGLIAHRLNRKLGMRSGSL